MLLVSISWFTFSQVPHNVDVPSNNSAERVARFKVQGVNRDFLEITNATQHNGKFIPILWGHQESDNRYDLAFFATTKSSLDNGSIPLMKFRAEIRNSINLNAPNGTSTFPWGNVGSNVINRPVFAWENGDTQLMTMRANGNLGIGLINPLEKLHINGSIRGNATGGALQVKTQYGSINVGPQNSDWAHLYTDRPKFIFNKPVYEISGKFSSYYGSNLYLQASGVTRIFVDRYSGYVGIGNTSPTSKLDINGTLRIRTLSTNFSDSYVLTTDNNGYVHKRLISSIGGGSNNCGSNNFVIKNSNGNNNCSQIFDDGSKVGIGTSSPSYRLSVNGAVHSMTNLFISDRKFKKNIEDIKKPLETILNLHGKTYNWRKKEFKKYNFTDRKQIGFIAQEVEKIIPEVVFVDKDGEYSMNYTAIIPILVEAIKKQQEQINYLKDKIIDYKSLDVKDNLGLTKTYFSSNYPNPFAVTTRVNYYIDENVINANIILYDTIGNMLRKFNLTERGQKSYIIINKKDLQTGIYFYTLIVDDNVIGTKKMIIK